MTSKKPSTFVNKKSVTLFILFSLALLGLYSVRNSIKAYFIQSKNRPTIGEDFGNLKIIYKDLFDYNSNTFNVAGSPEFSINTEKPYPVRAGEIDDLTEKIRTENLINIAYSQKEEAGSTQVKNLVVKTNQWHKISQEHKKVKKITLKSVSGNLINDVKVELIEQFPLENNAETLAGKSIRLFNYFLSVRRNGDSPLGRDFRISFEEFCEIYGYGQCNNQSYALADLFERNGIPVRLIRLSDPAHMLVEAKVTEQNWAAFDPLLGDYFIDAEKNLFLNFNEIQVNLDAALKQFAVKDYEQSKFWYANNAAQIRPFVNSKDSEKLRSLSVKGNQYIEYNFGANAPWLSMRNITPPPKETVGFIKFFQGEGTIFEINQPYPINSAVAEFLHGDTKLAVDNEEVIFNPSWKFARLDRFLWFDKQAKVEASKPINLAIILQFSILPYYRFTDGFIRVNAEENEEVEVMIEYLTN